LAILSFDELEPELAAGRFRATYLFLGPEEYLVRRAIALLKEKAIPPEMLSFNFAQYDGQDADVAEIIERANTFPLMCVRRIVLVTQVEKLLPAGQEALAAYCGAPHKRTVLVLAAAELDRRSPLYRRMAEHGCVVEFPKLKEAALERWAGSSFSRSGFHIAPLALRKLIDLAGSDLLSLANEMEKLVLYAGKPREIKEADVDALVLASRQHRIFELTGALGRRDRKVALRVLGNLLEGGDGPLYILSMLARHYRQIIISKELLAAGRNAREIAAAVQVPEWALAELLRQAQALELGTARIIYQRLAQIDRSFKSSSPDERMVLEHLVCML
jgi:DNA polymerase-3 subunit delta